MKRKYIWLIEIIVWLLIFSLGLVSFIYNTSVKENLKNMYYTFFDDVDGLVQGSPVRLMGIDIGYVRDVKIFDNKVFVSFLVTKKDIVIPNRVTATIAFYGLGGSTSLELDTTTASDDSKGEIILEGESYRVQDLWDGQELVSKVLIDVYGGMGNTIEKSDLINNKQLLKQSKLISEVSRETSKINTAQSVIIYKLTESTLDYQAKKKEVSTNE